MNIKRVSFFKICVKREKNKVVLHVLCILHFTNSEHVRTCHCVNSDSFVQIKITQYILKQFPRERPYTRSHMHPCRPCIGSRCARQPHLWRAHTHAHTHVGTQCLPFSVRWSSIARLCALPLLQSMRANNLSFFIDVALPRRDKNWSNLS